MSIALVECVPNFSEGRNAAVVARISDAVRATPGVQLLDITTDRDHHRSVLTFAGDPDAVEAAAFASVREAVQCIDLNAHAGVHPRVGAADVIPFVPVSGITLEECGVLAQRVGARIWKELGIPVYFYGAGRQDLAIVRRSIREGRHPDVGGPEHHPTAGVSVLGARKYLLAFNIDLDSTDIGAARAIAAAVRSSSGGLPEVKALGLWLASRGRVQVSMNLTDFRTASLVDVYHAVELECAALGIDIVGSELIGLAPQEALNAEIAHKIRLAHFGPEMILERRLASIGDS